MKRIIRFKPFSESESDVFQKQTIAVDNTYRAEFYGADGRYELKWYPDDDMLSIVFPDGKISYLYTEVLSPDSEHPLNKIEDGKLMSWIRHMIYTEDYNRTSFADEYKVESQMEWPDNIIHYFIFKDVGYEAKYNIDQEGTIFLTMPERVIIGTPDQICDEKEMGGLASLFGGKLMSHIKKNYEEITGKKF